MPSTEQTLLHHNKFVVDASLQEQEIVDFLHANGIMETSAIYSPRKNWFKTYHYIQLIGENNMKYLYVNIYGKNGRGQMLSEVTVEYFKRYVLSKLSNVHKN